MTDLDPISEPRCDPVSAGIIGLLLLAAMTLGLLAWNGNDDSIEVRTAHPPMTFPEAPEPEVAPVEMVEDGWPVDWTTRHEIALYVLAAATPEPEVVAYVAPPAPPTTVAAPSPPPAPVAVPAPPPGYGIDDWPWPQLRNCEATGNWSINTGNGYYGAYQFHQGTWDGIVNRIGLGEWAGRRASDAPPEVQHAAAVALHQDRGFQPWPGCRSKLGL